MTHQGQPESPESNIFAELSASNAKASSNPVFRGNAYLPNPQATSGNLAVQRSLMQIFDEFTQVISGELKSMNLEEFEEQKNQ